MCRRKEGGKPIHRHTYMSVCWHLKWILLVNTNVNLYPKPISIYGLGTLAYYHRRKLTKTDICFFLMFAPALSTSVLCFIIGLFRLVTFIVFLISCLALPISVCPVLGFRQHCGESPRGGSWSCHRSQPLIKSSNTSWFDQLGRSFAFSSDHTRECWIEQSFISWSYHPVISILFGF